MNNLESTTERNISESDIKCVFVCHFHVKRGNTIEWVYPSSFDLKSSGIEFKCLPSGSHLISSDCIYFKFKNMFGVSAFRNIPLTQTASAATSASGDTLSQVNERGSRMKSVGFICTNVDRFWEYRDFLRNRALELCQISPSETSHEQYEKLIEYFHHQQSTSSHIHNPITCPNEEDYGFASLLDSFGVNLLVLWKLCLLNLRIIFYSTPPLEKLCNQLPCFAQLSSTSNAPDQLLHNANGEFPSLGSFKVCFFITLSDLSALSDDFNEGTRYVACTSDKVVEEVMQGCYDIFVDGSSIRSWRRDLQHLLKASRADEQRFIELQNIRNCHKNADTQNLLNSVLRSYFVRLNDGVFEVLSGNEETTESNNDNVSEHDRMLANRNRGEITEQTIAQMGLMPKYGDTKFIQELIVQYNLDYVVELDSGCCPVF